MANEIQLPKIDRSAYDFITIRQDLITFLQAKFPNDFTDFTESQLGIILLELFAHVGDSMSFKEDRVANEVFLSTCTERDSAVKISRLIGFRPTTATAAQVQLVINNQQAFGFDATVLKGTKIKVGGLTFEIDNNFTLPAGDTVADPGPTASEGETIVDNFIGDGTTFQTYVLTRNPLILGTLEVRVNSILFSEIDALVLAGGTNVYTLRTDGEDRGTVQFGDGVNGVSPASGSSIQVTYRVGGGTEGNISSGAIKQNVSAILTTTALVQVFVQNNESATGGSNRQSLDSIKFFAPRVLKTHGNAVTLEDYDALAGAFSDPIHGAIARAKAYRVPGNTNCRANEINVFVLAVDSNQDFVPAGTALKQSLLTYLNDRRVLNQDIFIVDGRVKNINLQIDVTVSLQQREPQAIKDEITAKMTAFFQDVTTTFGDIFYVSRLYDLIQEVPGVLHNLIQDPVYPGVSISDIETDLDQIYYFGTVTINLFIIGENTRDLILVPTI